MFCVPNSRRSFLTALGGGLGTLAASVLAADEAGVKRTRRIQLDPLQPNAPRRPQFAAKAKSVIVLFMVGGPSSMDSFDYKPALQQHHGKPLPASIRDSLQGTKFVDVLHGTKDELMASPFGWKQYGQNGMWISDLFPNTAGHVDKLCFLHSVRANWNEFNLLFKQLYSGNRRTVNQQLANNCSSALVGLSCVACCSISTNSPTSTDNNNRRMDRLLWLCF